jgi:hypothetical protein
VLTRAADDAVYGWLVGWLAGRLGGSLVGWLLAPLDSIQGFDCIPSTVIQRAGYLASPT